MATQISTQTTTRPAGAAGWRRAGTILLGVMALITFALVAIIYQEDRQLNIGLVILAVVGVGLTAASVAVPRAWLFGLAALFFMVMLAGDGVPHMLPRLLHPQGGPTVFAAVSLAVQIAGLIVSAFAALSLRGTRASR